MQAYDESIAIYFEEPAIKYLFAELLEARGVRTHILETIDQAPKHSKIITEPQFFPQIDPRDKEQCLLVGNKHSLENCKAITLSRPLTEEKIESAFSRFL